MVFLLSPIQPFMANLIPSRMFPVYHSFSPSMSLLSNLFPRLPLFCPVSLVFRQGDAMTLRLTPDPVTCSFPRGEDKDTGYILRAQLQSQFETSSLMKL